MTSDPTQPGGGAPTNPLRAARATGGILMIAAVVLLAFNLRPAVNALGVVIPELQESTGISSTVAGILLALPTLCFALMGFAVSMLTRKMGARQIVTLSLVVLTAGQVLRAVSDNIWLLFAGSILALAAITFGNVLLPGLIRQYFPSAIGLMTAVYTTVMMMGQTAGAGLTLPIEHALGGTWQLGIGMWAATAAVALVPWVAALMRAPGKNKPGPKAQTPSGASTVSAQPPASRAMSMAALARSPHAWATAIFFGMQSLQAYVVFGWMPAVLTEAGISQDAAGGLLAIATAMAIPISAVVPALLGATNRHGTIVTAFVTSLGLGYLALILVPTMATWFQMVLIGFGLGLFPMVLMLFALRARSHEGTTALSGFGQSVGYLLASAGPVGFGLLHDLSGSSTVPLIAMIITLVPMLAAGLVTVRDWKIEDDLPAAAR